MDHEFFKREHEVYEARKAELLKAGLEGKWIVIKGDRVIGTFDTPDVAYEEGVKAVGATEPFLLKQIGGQDPVLDLPAYHAGVLGVSFGVSDVPSESR
jgi:hypothetical protein